MSLLKTMLGTLVVLLLVLLLFAYSGVYNVAADEPHAPWVRTLLETARDRSIVQRREKVKVPVNLSSAERARQGAKMYGDACQACHIAPGVAPTPVHQGLNPKPPVLHELARNPPPDRLFWIVKHGIKMTGMPAWGETHGDDELWDVVAFVAKLPEMTPQQYEEMVGRAGTRAHSDAHGTASH